MSEKRRDSKGRILRTGESQRPDGRYAYKYNDASGKPQFVYSWRLEPGDRRIDWIKLSDAKECFVQLQESGKPDGTGYRRSSIKGVRGILRLAFRMAVGEQERACLAFVKQDKYYCRYYNAIYVLFHTGLRISEFAGLTVADVDLEKREIMVDHQLLRDRKVGYYISDTKTTDGVRKVPMTDAVCACFRRMIANRPVLKVEPIIDGKCGFFFVGRDRMPLTGVQWAWIFGFIWKKYAKSMTIQMPKVTPHVCRHTFYTNMVKSGINPKALQYIMGHSNIAVTLNTYIHVGFADAQKEFRRVLEGK